MLELFKQGNDYSDLHAIELPFTSNIFINSNSIFLNTEI